MSTPYTFTHPNPGVFGVHYGDQMFAILERHTCVSSVAGTVDNRDLWVIVDPLQEANINTRDLNRIYHICEGFPTYKAAAAKAWENYNKYGVALPIGIADC